jgi:hypothetical protein
VVGTLALGRRAVKRRRRTAIHRLWKSVCTRCDWVLRACGGERAGDRPGCPKLWKPVDSWCDQADTSPNVKSRPKAEIR